MISREVEGNCHSVRECSYSSTAPLTRPILCSPLSKIALLWDDIKHEIIPEKNRKTDCLIMARSCVNIKDHAENKREKVLIDHLKKMGKKIKIHVAKNSDTEMQS